MSKGDTYRPVDKKKYDENYDRIFRKVFCACTGNSCEGLCREKNLNRPRKFLKKCPAAYDVDGNGNEIRKDY